MVPHTIFHMMVLVVSFKKIGGIRAFLTGVMNRRYGRPVNFSDWEIVELETVVKEVKEVIDVVDSKKIVLILAR